MDEDSSLRTRISKRLQLLAAKVQELVKEPCINLKNHGLTDLELVKVVLPILESKVAESRYVAIDLSFNELTPLSARELARVLAGISEKVVIKGLHLDGNNWGDAGVSDFCAGFNSKLLGSLEVLTLGFSKITEHGAAALANKVLAHTDLKFLLLDCNPLGAKGVVEITKGLAHASRMECLSLGSVGATDVGMKAIAQALSGMNGLKQLSLAFNQVDDEGLKDLSAAIARSTRRLQKLDLSGNRLSDVGIKSLIPVIKFSDLDNIDITGNNFSYEVADELRSLVTLKKSKWSRTVQTLLSARDIPRLGKSAPVSTLPKELLRKMAEFLPQSEHVAPTKPQVVVLNWLVTLVQPEGQGNPQPSVSA